MIAAALTVITAATTSYGQCESSELARLTADDGQDEDWLGRSVGIFGDTAVVGAWYADDNGAQSGASYVFRYNGCMWVHEAKLLASDGESQDMFGVSVAVSDDIAVVGAFRDDDSGDDSGSAYVFRFDGSDWLQEAKLTASDGAPGDWFGYSVAIAGETIVIGAARYDYKPWTPESGAVYVFGFNGSDWVERATLLPSTITPEDWFGHSVAISNGVIAVGMPQCDDANGKKNSGAVYIFRFNGLNWLEEAQLLAADGNAKDLLGWSVAISADGTVLTGAFNDDDNGPDSGSAYVFRLDGSNWIEEAKLTAFDGAEGDEFGASVAVSGDVAIVGAFYDDDDGSGSGSVYAFYRDDLGWAESAKLTASDAGTGSYFGASVSLSEEGVVLIGAPRNEDMGSRSGSAYVFGGMDDCNNNGMLDLCDIVLGLSRDWNGNGVPYECECSADVNNDTKVNIDDLFRLLGAWGSCEGCAEDINQDCKVNIDDLFVILGEWGPCPEIEMPVGLTQGPVRLAGVMGPVW